MTFQVTFHELVTLAFRWRQNPALPPCFRCPESGEAAIVAAAATATVAAIYHDREGLDGLARRAAYALLDASSDAFTGMTRLGLWPRMGSGLAYAHDSGGHAVETARRLCQNITESVIYRRGGGPFMAPHAELMLERHGLLYLLYKPIYEAADIVREHIRRLDATTPEQWDYRSHLEEEFRQQVTPVLAKACQQFTFGARILGDWYPHNMPLKEALRHAIRFADPAEDYFVFRWNGGEADSRSIPELPDTLNVGHVHGPIRARRYDVREHVNA